MKNWKESSFIDGAVYCEHDGFVEVYRVDPYTDGPGFTVEHGLLKFEDINLRGVLEAFDCSSIAELKNDLGAEWKQNAVLAWFDMDCKNDPLAYRVRQVPFSFYDEAVQQMHRMSGYRMRKTSKPGKWQKAGVIDNAIFREKDGFLEVYMVDSFKADHNTLCHGLVRFEDVDFDKLLSCFDYTSIAELKEDSGPYFRQNAMLMWFQIQCGWHGSAYMVRQDPFEDYKEAMQMMHLLASDEDEDDGLDISKALTVSTAHIRPETAGRMDAEAINAGFYAAKEGGYVILTVGWENYADEMPQDLKDCVEFAAGHGCDWLILDGDADIAKGLMVYEWEN